MLYNANISLCITSREERLTLKAKCSVTINLKVLWRRESVGEELTKELGHITCINY